MSPLTLSIGNTEITFLPISAGNFIMGSSHEEIAHAVEEFPYLEKSWFEKEYPQHTVNVGDFYVAQTLVTNGQWQVFMDANDITDVPSGFNAALPGHPVWGVSHEELEQFCVWLSELSGEKVSIPTEGQWEKAARGNDKREYPWGNDFDSQKCNTKESGRGTTTPVGSFPNGKSPYGILDMAGNVEEWTSTKYQPYEGGQPITDRFGGPGEYFVVRGGSFDHEGDLARCARRHGGPYEHSIVGARLVIEDV